MWRTVESINKLLGIFSFKEIAALRDLSKGFSRVDIQIIIISLEENYCKPCKCFFNVKSDDCANCPIGVQLARLRSLLNV